MSDLLNRKNFFTFSTQCRGAGVTAIDVLRADGSKELRLKYRARDPRTGRIFAGEWIAPKKDGTAEASEKAFFELAEKEFAVTRRAPEEKARG